MKVLVYGAGVIGSYVCHELCENGNDVTLLARGERGDRIRKKGLIIYHEIQRKETKDRVKVTNKLDTDIHYDAVFVVMQYLQMWAVLDDVAKANTELVVLVGNNMSSGEMREHIIKNSGNRKTVLFGFSATAGRRENDKLICVRFGATKMTCGAAYGKTPKAAKKTLERIFGDKYTPNFTNDMDSWLKCHAVFILPICYLSYILDCNLKHITHSQLSEALEAVKEGYGLLDALGYKILPEDTLSSLHGFKGKLSYTMLWIMAKTKIGELAVTEHCRNAVCELEGIDKAFEKLRGEKPDFSMPAWDSLKAAMPDWDILKKIYP